MAGTTITMTKLKQIISLRKNGIALQVISKAVGISRNTVKKYLRLIEVKGYSFDVLIDKEEQELQALLEDPNSSGGARLDALKQLFPVLERELHRTGVNRWVLWGEYRPQASRRIQLFTILRPFKAMDGRRFGYHAPGAHCCR
jgi:hypothetical protein